MSQFHNRFQHAAAQQSPLSSSFDEVQQSERTTGSHISTTRASSTRPVPSRTIFTNGNKRSKRQSHHTSPGTSSLATQSLREEIEINGNDKGKILQPTSRKHEHVEFPETKPLFNSYSIDRWLSGPSTGALIPSLRMDTGMFHGEKLEDHNEKNGDEGVAPNFDVDTAHIGSWDDYW
ncbi:hypothetical protein N431DRAFT_452379 [Stipitochalara longipes BDJ]|nr:hypothetical protein N431DRAFT_452379 [Stipitochalara longipes BDJ]